MNRSMWILSFAVALAWCGGTTAAMAQDLENGRRLSERWCAACHSVQPGSGKSKGVPSFAIIAARENISAGMIASFLLLPHATMPNFPLSRKDADDIAAFIMAMKK
jgi:mono/diheme cytochrome c family protein